jgi:MFS transporter, MHS family, alpha-ketoglutarate permease
VIALVGFWIRRGAEETHPAQEELAAGYRPPLFAALVRHPRASLW